VLGRKPEQEQVRLALWRLLLLLGLALVLSTFSLAQGLALELGRVMGLVPALGLGLCVPRSPSLFFFFSLKYSSQKPSPLVTSLPSPSIFMSFPGRQASSMNFMHSW